MELVICKKRQSILEAEGHCLVLGGPGSGKTTLGLLKALDRTGSLAPGQSILFLSFSRAAVARITSAVQEHLPYDRRSLLSVQTFHSFFWQILQAHGYLLGCPRNLQIVQSHEEASLRNGIKPDESLLWGLWESQRRELFSKEGRVCFDMFAPLTSKLLAGAKRLRDRISKRYPLLVVDEAQDTNEDQWSCVQLLSADSQIVCLADPDQMIYGHLPGVTENRLPLIRQSLSPLEVDLGSDNNRSPGTDIAKFARDIYKGTTTQKTYSGISLLRFDKQAVKRDKQIRTSIAVLIKAIVQQTGHRPKSIAILAAYSSGVAIVSNALQQSKPISHQVLFDEAFALLSARAAAFVLEPKREDERLADMATLLKLVATAFQAKGTITGRTLSDRCLKYAEELNAGKTPKVKLVAAAQSAVIESRTAQWSGDPRKDWSSSKRILQATGEASFIEMSAELDYLVAFGRGRRISEGLSSVWLERGCYHNARKTLNAALLEDQLVAGNQVEAGIYVMNTHKAKGKQFDGVILYRQEHHSPFVWRNENSPYAESRRLLHMGITRACKHVLILSEAYPACPLLRSHGFA